MTTSRQPRLGSNGAPGLTRFSSRSDLHGSVGGGASHFGRRTREGKPDWDMAVVAGPRGAVCFALDLAYVPDPDERVFTFGSLREATVTFPLPAYLRRPVEVLRVTADAVAPVPFTTTENGVAISGHFGADNIFLGSPRAGLAKELEARRRELAALEASFGFDPARNPADLAELQRILTP